MDRDLQRLTEMAADVQKLESRLKKRRDERNRLALQVVESGRHSLRKVAELAGITNPYLVQLKRESNGDK